MTQNISKEQMKQLLTAQQGELDAVYMYERLAARVKDEEDRQAFLRLSKDEARHASVFFNLTNQELSPKKVKGIVVPLLYSLLGKKKLYPVIAKGEYDAADGYKDLAAAFPDVVAVMNDEVHHGDAVMGLLGK